MDSRRLVVWISAGILGFQGGTLVLDLIHCSVLSWLYLRRYGLELVGTAKVVQPPLGVESFAAQGGGLEVPPHDQPRSQPHSSTNQRAPPQPHPQPGGRRCRPAAEHPRGTGPGGLGGGWEI